jgi:subtilisin family serine protease
MILESKNYMKNSNKLTAIVALGSLLVGCGGGDSGGAGGTNPTQPPPVQTSPPSQTYSLSTPAKLLSYPSTGIASTNLPLSDYGTATLTFPEETPYGRKYYAMTTPADSYGPQAHLSDISAMNAWREGWTGKGSTISIIDDFTNSTAYTIAFTPAKRKKDSSAYNGTYSAEYNVAYTTDTSVNHGNLVSNIAGGDYLAAKTSAKVTLKVKTDSNLISGSCVINSRTSQFSTPTCDSSFYENYYLAGISQSAVLTRQQVPGIASQALVIENTINLSSSQNALKTVADLQGHLQNSISADVINLSLGSEIPTTNRTFDEVMGEVKKFPLPRQINSIITVAAGNGGTPCAISNLNGCNAVAVSLAFQDQTKATTIVVGALSGSATTENIATYSTRAGILADRFILAQGDTGFYTSLRGTSFAAPRVAGVAAILKQKYPSLTASQITSVILLSADKDINNDGIPDFTGVSPIFGHGKLSLSRALALAGAI